MRTIPPFEQLLKLEVATNQIGGGRQAVEIIDLERGDLVGAEKSVVGIAPRATPVTLTAVFEMIHQPEPSWTICSADVCSLAQALPGVRPSSLFTRRLVW